MYDAWVSVFLSYRREDSAGYAGRICDHLNAVLGPDSVFMDVQDIAPGQDFTQAIETTISACRVVFVIIGPRWAAEIQRRSGGEDFVCIEVAAALRRDVTVVPVLVGGAAMPSAADLPESVKPLSRRQAFEVRETSFEEDVKLLAATLKESPGVAPGPRRARRGRWFWMLPAAGLLVLAAFGLYRWYERPRIEIDGIWIAQMQKAEQPPYRVRLELAGGDGKLIGRVRYPTGDAVIQGGAREQDRLTFFTVHTPQFASQEATIRWTGVIAADAIRVTSADEDGIATGIAHRRK